MHYFTVNHSILLVFKIKNSKKNNERRWHTISYWIFFTYLLLVILLNLVLYVPFGVKKHIMDLLIIGKISILFVKPM